jgi:hypothetical protein
LAGRAGTGFLAGDRIDPDVAEPAVEVAVIRAAAEFAVRGKVKSDALLQEQRVFDCLVFGLGERGRIDLAAGEFGALPNSACGRSRLPMCSARNGGMACDSIFPPISQMQSHVATL